VPCPRARRIARPPARRRGAAARASAARRLRRIRRTRPGARGKGRDESARAAARSGARGPCDNAPACFSLRTSELAELNTLWPARAAAPGGRRRARESCAAAARCCRLLIRRSDTAQNLLKWRVMWVRRRGPLATMHSFGLLCRRLLPPPEVLAFCLSRGCRRRLLRAPLLRLAAARAALPPPDALRPPSFPDLDVHTLPRRRRTPATGWTRCCRASARDRSSCRGT